MNNPLILESDSLTPKPLFQAHTPESSKTRTLHTAMRQRRFIMDCHIVDMHGTGLDLLGDAETSQEILGEDSGGETIVGMVGDFNSFLFRVKGHDRDGGAERFRVVDVHVLRNVLQDDGMHTGACGLLGRHFTMQQFRSLGQAVFQQLTVLCHTAGVDEHGGVLVFGEKALRGSPEFLREGGFDVSVYQHALR